MKHLFGLEKFVAEQYKKQTNFYQSLLDLKTLIDTKETAQKQVASQVALSEALGSLVKKNYGTAPSGTNRSDAYWQLGAQLFSGFQNYVSANQINGKTIAKNDKRDNFLVHYFMDAIKPGGGLQEGYLILPEESELQAQGFADTKDFKLQLAALIQNAPAFLSSSPGSGPLNESEKKQFIAALDALKDPSKVKPADLQAHARAEAARIRSAAAASSASSSSTSIGGSSKSSAAHTTSTTNDEKLKQLDAVVNDAKHATFQMDLYSCLGLAATKNSSANAIKSWASKIDTDLEVTFTDENGAAKTAKISVLKSGTAFEKALAADIEKNASPTDIVANQDAAVKKSQSLAGNIKTYDTQITDTLSVLNTEGVKDIAKTSAELQVNATAYAKSNSGANGASKVNAELFAAASDLAKTKTSSSSSSTSHQLSAEERAFKAAVTKHEVKIKDRVKNKYSDGKNDSYYVDTKSRIYEKNRLTRLATAKANGLATTAVAVPKGFNAGGIAYDPKQDRILVNAHRNSNNKNKSQDVPTIALDEGYFVNETTGEMAKDAKASKAILNESLIGSGKIAAGATHDNGTGHLATYLNAQAGNSSSPLHGFTFVCEPHSDPDAVEVFVKVKDAKSGGVRDLDIKDKNELAARNELIAQSTKFLDSKGTFRFTDTTAAGADFAANKIQHSFTR